MDSLTIAASTVAITSMHHSDRKYRTSINNTSIAIMVPKDSVLLDVIELKYRVFPLNIGTQMSFLDSTQTDIRDQAISISSDQYYKDRDQQSLFGNNSLDYSGSFSRGLSFGNSQDLILNSDLNLQMVGDLGNGLEVKAAISDDNIPIQAEGNTQVLQEFDKVFVEVSKNNTSVIAGDYELANPKSYFSRYYKKLKGLSISHADDLNEDIAHNTQASYAISRGKFVRINLETSEGNQGPYQLKSDSGNRFLIILSGTEKIYLDGRVLKRGLDFDYIIDYNRAEISFTNNTLITKDSRILVEYEIADQNYLRSLYAVSSQLKAEKWGVQFSMYNEQDSKTATGNVELDSTAINILSNSGDDPTLAVRSGVVPSNDNNTDLILYQMQFEASIADSILIYDRSQTQGFTASFSDVGQGKGSYSIDNQANANGRVYKFVGFNMGNYEPVIKLATPERKFLSSLGAHYDLREKTRISAELAWSNLDINRFSAIDNDDNTDLALYTKLTDKMQLDTAKNWSLISQASMEIKRQNFNALNPYRVAEFGRDWNYIPTNSATERLASIGTQIHNNELGSLGYQFQMLDAVDNYFGQKHISTLKFNKSGWQIDAVHNLLLAEEQNVSKTRFLRPNARFRKSFWEDLLVIGSRFEKEQNRINNLDDQSLQLTSFDFEVIESYIESQINPTTLIGVSALERKDWAVANDQFDQSTEAREYGLYGKHHHQQTSLLDWKLKFRNLMVIDSTLTEEIDNKTLLARVGHQLNIFNSGILVNSVYETSTGQEPKFEEQFIEVQKGQGTYIWNDNDPQDSIQQINEFVISPFADQANYEKVSLFNNEFLSVSKSLFNQSIKIDPRRWIGPEANKWNKQLARLSWTSRYRIDQKINDEAAGTSIRFVSLDFRDPSFAAYNASFDHSLFINRGNPKYDGALGYRSFNSKIVQINGFELRLSKAYYSRWRIRLLSQLDLELKGEIAERTHDSENFDNRDFELDEYELEPSITYRPNHNFRTIFKYKYGYKQNTIPGSDELAKNHEMGFELTWRRSTSSNLQLGFDLVNISYVGEENTPVEWQMLQGLKPGINYLWNVSYTKRLSNSLDMIINYNGRRTGSAKSVHVFGAQVKASF